MLLYIHIPYCDSKCYYCSFNSYVDKFDTRKEYMNALYKQLQFELKRFNIKEKTIDTLFIGGGTPSTIEPKLYIPIFKLINPYLKLNAELTIEANPNSATKKWLKGMRAFGINRISFGVQSFNTQKLKALNRAHTSKEAKNAILNAKDIGYEHISLDLIYNYKDDDKITLLKDIEEAFKLPIDHISAYELTIEDGTKFSATPNVRQESDEIAFFMAKEIQKRGFKQYEISNFGTYQSRHNKGYWKLDNYIGAGAGAVGFLKDTRFYPHTNINSYINNPFEIKEELLTQEELLTEKIFLGLRSCIGIDKSILSPEIEKKAQLLYIENKLIQTDKKYFNTNFFLSDELALFILN